VIEAITFDFGNTLVPVPAAGLRAVVNATAGAMADRLGPFDRAEVLRVWAEERERQFREEVPQFREVDLAQREAWSLSREQRLGAFDEPDVLLAGGELHLVLLRPGDGWQLSGGWRQELQLWLGLWL
jgi:FMN phosphatase YigB (HAD superfamily)